MDIIILVFILGRVSFV